MGRIMRYSAIVTKIRAMEGRLLAMEDYEKLAGMDNLFQAAEYLRRIPCYEAVLEGEDIASLHRGDMERLLADTVYYDFIKLYRFADKPQKEILKLYFRKYEISEIKRALRRVLNAGKGAGAPVSYSKLMDRFTDIRLPEMNLAGTINELMSALSDTDYKKLFDKTGVLEKGSLFDCEMVLDLFYFTEIWKLKDKLLRKDECNIITETFGYRIDILNMTWIYRAKKYYDVSDSAVYGLLIPVKYKLRDGELQNMVTAPDMEKLETALRETYYGRKFRELNPKGLESFYHEFLWKAYAGRERREPYSIASVTGYLFKKEEEIRKLKTVLEGIRYGLAKEETLLCIDRRYDR